jgi:hypothetical protein
VGAAGKDIQLAAELSFAPRFKTAMNRQRRA